MQYVKYVLHICTVVHVLQSALRIPTGQSRFFLIKLLDSVDGLQKSTYVEEIVLPKEQWPNQPALKPTHYMFINT